MGGPGFAKLGNQLIRENNALKDSLNKNKRRSGKNLDGTKPLKFGKANKATKARILYDKSFVEKQIRFRIGVLVFGVVLAGLLLFLILSFG